MPKHTKMSKRMVILPAGGQSGKRRTRHKIKLEEVTRIPTKRHCWKCGKTPAHRQNDGKAWCFHCWVTEPHKG